VSNRDSSLPELALSHALSEAEGVAEGVAQNDNGLRTEQPWGNHKGCPYILKR